MNPRAHGEDAKNIRTGAAVMGIAQALVDAGHVTPSSGGGESRLERAERQRDQNARLFKDFEDYHARQLAERDERLGKLEATLRQLLVMRDGADWDVTVERETWERARRALRGPVNPRPEGSE